MIWYTHKKMTFFKDPDGLPLELHGYFFLKRMYVKNIVPDI